MSRKNLLSEGAVRQFGKLAQITPLTESFIEERAEEFNEGEDVTEGADETLEEDNFDKTGRGPHREGAGKNGEQQGIASNQGKEPKSTPDGKLEIPGTGYAGDHKNTGKSPSKGSTDGGTQLQGKGTVTENMGMEDEFEEEPDEMAPPMDAEPPMPDAGGAPDLEGLVAAIAQAITAQTGVEVSVAGHAEPDGDEMGMPPPPGDMGAEPPMDAAPDMGAEPPMGGEELPGEEEEEVVEQRFSLEEVDDATFQAEATRRGFAMQEQKVEEDDAAVQQEAMVERIARDVAKRLTTRGKKSKRVAKK